MTDENVDGVSVEESEQVEESVPTPEPQSQITGFVPAMPARQPLTLDNISAVLGAKTADLVMAEVHIQQLQAVCGDLQQKLQAALSEIAQLKGEKAPNLEVV